jgi:hypothetical protein
MKFNHFYILLPTVILASSLFSAATLAGLIRVDSDAFASGVCNDNDGTEYSNEDNLNNWQLSKNATCINEWVPGGIYQESKSTVSINAFTGETKLFAESVSNASGNTRAISSAYLSSTISFNPLDSDITIYFDLNVEGWLKDDNGEGWGGGFNSAIYQDLSINNNYQHQKTWNSSDYDGDYYISDLTTVAYELSAGTSSINFVLTTSVGVGTFNWGYASGDFQNTSWFNIRFSEDIQYESDIEGLLSDSRQNIGTISNDVPEPSTFAIFVLAMFGVVSRRFLNNYFQ